ncbi:Glucosidase I [Ceraceosorus bombacis]|uniref:Mannosyl-oligosaccharide glucosidase n=1 Tax=Ceraceosorus bombacis TaxID=401625 RepID=A0A0P1BH86_9BASI|nr:Glucosidase I [Ceraceosorus bombacis]
MRRLSLTLASLALSLSLFASLFSASIASSDHNDTQADSLLWGTYRPGLYFGVRARLPDSPLFAFSWHGLQDYNTFSNTRFEAGQGGDDIESYGWTHHDGRGYGKEWIVDTKVNVRLQLEWIRESHGWTARISGEPIDAARPCLVMSYLHISSRTELEATFDEDAANDIGGLPAHPATSQHEPFVTSTHADARIGKWTLGVRESAEVRNQPADAEEPAEQAWSFLGEKVDQTWDTQTMIDRANQDTIRSHLQEVGHENVPPPAHLLALPNELASSTNAVAFARGFQGAFSFDVYFTTNGAKRSLSGKELTAALSASREAYDERFDGVLGLAAKGYDSARVRFAKELTSGLVGGIGYWAGAGVVDRSFKHPWDENTGTGAMDFDELATTEPDPRLTEEMQLFSATPSRSFFPRGFYWDEGFHLAHIGVWDNDLSLEILESWIDLIDDDGWVAREQILGDEARKRVPREFQTQYPLYANPPTLTMALGMYIDRLMAAQQQGQGAAGDVAFDASYDASPQQVFGSRSSSSERYLNDPDLARSFLARIYPKLRTHYQWFRRTQRGEIEQWDRTARSREAYRWRGRTKSHVLTSGLDDYPRAQTPHSGELHLDLISWMGFFAQTMQKIAEATGEERDAKEYEEHHKGVLENLEDLHWSDKDQLYCDAAVDEADTSFHVCHRGYVSLFPFLLGLLPTDSPHLKSILDMIEDPEHLWSKAGIRSLSKQDVLFGKDEDYWRSPSWAPMNYLALGALHKKYAALPGPHQMRCGKLYEELRRTFVENVYQEYKRTGFAWEQYSTHAESEGQGRKNKPFTGWTSLVALMMAEIY